MAETKFTQGPWMANVWVCGRRSVCLLLTIGGKDAMPARVHTQEIAEVWPTHDEDEFRANANLIAAAPEMYEAIEKLCRAIATGDENRYAIAENYGMSALAKARGES